MKGRTVDEVRETYSNEVARRALAHTPPHFLIEKFCASGEFTADEAHDARHHGRHDVSRTVGSGGIRRGHHTG